MALSLIHLRDAYMQARTALADPVRDPHGATKALNRLQRQLEGRVPEPLRAAWKKVEELLGSLREGATNVSKEHAEALNDVREYCADNVRLLGGTPVRRTEPQPAPVPVEADPVAAE